MSAHGTARRPADSLPEWLDAGRRIGCVLGGEVGVLVVLTDQGELRASYGSRMLGAVARDRTRVPEPGEWVVLQQWSDARVTVEEVLAGPPGRALATVHPLEGRRPGRPSRTGRPG